MRFFINQKSYNTLFILFVFFTFALGVSASDVPMREISVGLVYGEKATTEVALGSAGGFNICEALDGSEKVLTQLLYEKDIVAKLNADVISLYLKGQDKLLYEHKGKGIITLRPINSTIWAVGMEYRGAIQLVPRDGRLNIINLIDMEQYLYGVVTKEMYAGWPVEALKAQAVCSRTYLLASGIGRHKNQGFDLCASVHCQAYGGVAKEVARGIDAVEQTRGQVVKYNGEISEVFYYASSGGVTEDVRNVWGSEGYPYLISVQDIYENAEEAKSLWSVELTGEEVGKKLLTAGFDVGAVKDLVILETTPSGRVIKLLAKGEKGECTITKEKTRYVLGLKSQLYVVDTIGGEPTAYIKSEGGNTSLGISSIITSSGVVNAEGSVYIKTEGGTNEPITATPRKFIFKGRGHGHGIGMSQWGAKGMADKGFKYDEIIRFYFPGVEVGSMSN